MHANLSLKLVVCPCNVEFNYKIYVIKENNQKLS